MPDSIAGKLRIELAKITGMTPPVLTFNGMCVLEPPVLAAPDDAFGVLDGDSPVPRST